MNVSSQNTTSGRAARAQRRTSSSSRREAQPVSTSGPSRRTRSSLRSAQVTSASVDSVPSAASLPHTSPSPTRRTSARLSRKQKRSTVSGDSKDTKRRRASSVPRSYNLRSTDARRQRVAIPAVTPGTARHLRFDSDASISSSSHSSLPPGVINIFSKNHSCRPNCNCPATISVEKDTSLAVCHLLGYGEDFNSIMKAKENRDTLDLTNQPTLLGIDDRFDATDHPALDATLDISDSADFESTDPFPCQPLLTGRMRGTLVNWMVEVCQEYELSEDAYHLAVSLVDQVLKVGPTEDEMDRDEDSPYLLVKRQEFQTLGCACLWLASKMEDRNPPSQENLSYISDSAFTASDLREMENKVCQALDFRLHLPTPMHFVSVYLRASHACPRASCHFEHPVLRELVEYLLELARCSADLSNVKPSLLTAASIYLGRVTLGMAEDDPNHASDSVFWTKTLEHYTGYSAADLAMTVRILHKYQSSAETSTFSAAFKKYKKRSRRCVSLKTVVRDEDLALGEL